jgi:hypothetical protein
VLAEIGRQDGDALVFLGEMPLTAEAIIKDDTRQ